MSDAERLLIVNADDLGRTPGIGSGVFEAHARGLVTSATLMVNFPAAAQAAAELPRYPSLGVGLHIAFSGGVPTLPPERVPSLVDAEGRLPSRPDALTAGDPDEVLAEVEAQLARFHQLTGRPPTHLDGHHHGHRVPVIRDAVLSVARRGGLPVRNVSPEVGRRLRRAAIPTTDAFVEEFFGPEARLETLLRILKGLGPGVTEVMCHPAHLDESLRRGSSYVEERERELEILTHPDVLETAREEDLGLIHFGDL